MAASVWTNEQIIKQLNAGAWPGASISYLFPTQASDANVRPGGPEREGFVALNGNQQSAAQLAFMTWGDLIRPAFNQVTSGHADITLGFTNKGIDYAHANIPAGVYIDLGVGVWFNSSSEIRNPLTLPVVSNSAFETYVHELGHAIGLDHMGDYNGNPPPGGWKPSCWQDSTVYSVMSYFGPSGPMGGQGQVAWADWVSVAGIEISPQTPMLNDVMAVQAIYGAATTRPEDTVYGFHSNISGALSAIYNFANNNTPVLCIYDSGGIDTVDLSGFADKSSVDLIGGDGHFSSCNGMTSNIQIARNVVIENAITGSGNDVLVGNAVANFLSGGDGFDLLEGGAGNDELLGGKNGDELHGGQGDDLLRGGNGLDTLIGGEGNDTLLGALGTDVLTGGAGANVFRFNTALDGLINIDTITDFKAGIDKIELSASIFGAFAAQVGSSVGLNQNLTYNAASGTLFYDADGSGVHALAFAVLGVSSHPTTVGTDFWITA